MNHDSTIQADSVIGAIWKIAEAMPDQCALAAVDGTRISYSDLVRRAASLAFTLRSNGVGPGDRVLVHVTKSADSYVALLGVLAAQLLSRSR